MGIKINVGCGEYPLEGFVSVDIERPAWVAIRDPEHFPFLMADVTEGLPFGDETVGYIVAHHFLEHLHYPLGTLFLMECARVLEPGGVLTLVCPDFAHVVQQYNRDPSTLRAVAYLLYTDGVGLGDDGRPTFKHHFAAYDARLLLESCRKAGLEAERTALKDTPHCDARYEWQVAVRAVKPVPAKFPALEVAEVAGVAVLVGADNE